MSIEPKIEASWKEVLFEEFQKPYFSDLKQTIVDDLVKKTVIFPPVSQIFSAFDHTPFESVKVVILGQDPYHGQGQANGLCFSVSEGVKQPPSLVNIFKEIQADLGIPIPTSGNLESWANQGVLLLNAILTVRAHQAASHQGLGWEEFTDSVIRHLSDDRKGIVFLLWGKYAQEKGAIIDVTKHHVLKAPHPSPFSAHSGFFGCKHFSKTNAILREQGKKEINWNIE